MTTAVPHLAGTHWAPAPVWRRLTADPSHGPLPALLVGLTLLTGVVDAVSILSLGRVFVANMTGNVVFVGFAVAGAPGFSLAGALAALVGFLVGAGAGGQLIQRFGPDRARLLAAGSALELLFVTAALLVIALPGPSLSPVTRGVAAAVLAVGTGMQNAVVRKLAVPDLTTTVLTMTLTGIAADVRARRPSPALARRLLSVSTMLAGAVAGAELVLHAGASWAMALATAVLAVVTVAAALTTLHPGDWRVIGAPAGSMSCQKEGGRR
ncbi:MAG: hypothetical protein JWP14_2697 [Frankiales bacterium]|nr:hypothetical protein [Frankiales bacterium]